MVEKQLRKFIMPNVFAMIGMSCYILADTFFIAGAEGVRGITALNLTLPVYGLIFAMGAMIGIGSAIRYKLVKSTNGSDADDYFSNAIFWNLLLSLLFIGMGLFCPELVLKAMGADQDILKVGVRYLRIAMCFSPFFMTNYVFTAFVRNDDAPRVAMAAMIISSLFNIVFDYILMFPMNMGMVGAALATGVSPIVSMSVCMIHYLSGRNTIRWKWKLPSFHKFLSACHVGTVAFVGEIANGVTTMVFNFLLLNLGGNVAVAAYGVIANLALVGTAIFNGISQGLQPMASEAHGRGDRSTEEKIYQYSIRIAVVFAAGMVVMVCLLAPQCVAAFNREQSVEMASYAVKGLRLYFLGFLIAAINIIRAGFLSATGFGRESSLIAMSRGIVSIILLAFMLSRLFGMVGIWLAFPAAEIFTLLLTWRMGRNSNPKNHSVKKA